MAMTEDRSSEPAGRGGRWWLEGNFAPVTDELTETELPVTGRIPSEIDGLYVRNGANPVTGMSQHWFLGHGMVHGVRLRDGAAEWYRNRYVRTPFLDEPEMEMVAEDGTIDRTASVSFPSCAAHEAPAQTWSPSGPNRRVRSRAMGSVIPTIPPLEAE